MLRKMRRDEKPRKGRAKNVEKARANLMKDYTQLVQQTKKLQPILEKHNKKVDAQLATKLEIAAQKAHKKGKQFTSKERREIETKMKTSYRSAHTEVYYKMLQKYVKKLGPCEPDIDSVSPSTIQPGGQVFINGTCFGPSQGKVLLEITIGHVIELEVTRWTDVEIIACINSIIAEVPLRQHYGKIWIQTGEGVTSNVWPMMYKPIYGWYWATWTKHVFGGVFGKSISRTFLKDRMLGDGDFYIERAERSHWGDGWSTKQSPYASGQSLAQGWHIGVSAFGHAYMNLGYCVYGPKGIYPPYISQLGPWSYLGDDW